MGLDQNMTRAQFAKVIALTLGLKVNTGATPSYSDTSTSWAKEYIQAVTNAHLMNGVGMGKFDPTGNMTVEQMAKVLDEALKIDSSNVSQAVSGNVSDWAKAYVAAAIKSGIIQPSTNFTVPAKRSLLVNADYQAYQIHDNGTITVTNVTVKNANTVAFTFSNGQTQTKTLDQALVENHATPVTVTYQGRDYTKTVTYQPSKNQAPQITGTSATVLSPTVAKICGTVQGQASSVAVMGTLVSVNGSGQFCGDAHVTTGGNEITVTASNPVGSSTKSVSVTVAPPPPAPVSTGGSGPSIPVASSVEVTPTGTTWISIGGSHTVTFGVYDANSKPVSNAHLKITTGGTISASPSAGYTDSQGKLNVTVTGASSMNGTVTGTVYGTSTSATSGQIAEAALSNVTDLGPDGPYPPALKRVQLTFKLIGTGGVSTQGVAVDFSTTGSLKASGLSATSATTDSSGKVSVTFTGTAGDYGRVVASIPGTSIQVTQFLDITH